MITPVLRCTYLNVFEAKPNPSGKLKFSTAALISKKDKKGLDEIKAAINAAVQKGIEMNKFTKQQVASLRLPLRDGDAEYESGDRGPEYKGHYFFNCSSDNKPGIVKAQKGGAPVPLFDPDELYSGCYVRLDCNFFPYNQAGNRGVGCGLNNVMLVKQGDRLDGRMNADQAFAQYTEEDVEDDAVETSDLE